MLFVQFVGIVALIGVIVVLGVSRIRRSKVDMDFLVHIGISAVSLLSLLLLTFFSEFNFKMLWFAVAVQFVLTEFARSTGLLTSKSSQVIGKDNNR
ncbi:MAG: hypothetical protein Q3993_05095 [Filifactor alocis]|nr:hypothetical protein [Filifactor alocis]